MTSRVCLFGLGYEGLSVEEFCAQVVARDLGAVVDVRLNALSRKPGFSKSALRAALIYSGVSYVHLPALGNPLENRQGFAVPGSHAGNVARQRYREIFGQQDAEDAIDTIAELVMQANVGIMCFERNEQQCHRQLVIERVRAKLLACG